MNPRKLKLVEPNEAPADIYTAWKAEIASRDWERVHIRGDKRAPVDLGDRLRRVWR